MTPVHPLVVHLPIALILLWPIVDGAGLLLRRPDVSGVGVALLIAAVAAALVATATGQAALDAATRAHVRPDLLATHADKANPLPWALIAVVAVRLLGSQRLGRRGQALAIAFGVAIWPWIFLVGQTGGALVFEHGVGVEAAAPAGGAR